VLQPQKREAVEKEREGIKRLVVTEKRGSSHGFDDNYLSFSSDTNSLYQANYFSSLEKP
jgi:hypothetical protein